MIIKIIRISFIAILILNTSCKTKKTVAFFADPCPTMVLPHNYKQPVFISWYKFGNHVCGEYWIELTNEDGWRKINLKDGVLWGKSTYYKSYSSDSLGYNKPKKYISREDYFKNGLRDSIYKIYNKEGKVVYSTYFDQGTGLEKDFHENGKLYYEIATKDGYFIDTLKLYNDKGKLMEKRLYKKDSLVYHENFIFDENPTDNK